MSPDRLWDYLMILGVVLGTLACVVFCTLASVTPGNDNYGEFAVASAVVAGLALMGASAADD